LTRIYSYTLRIA